MILVVIIIFKNFYYLFIAHAIPVDRIPSICEIIYNFCGYVMTVSKTTASSHVPVTTVVEINTINSKK